MILSTQPTGDRYARDQSLIAPPFTTSDTDLDDKVGRFATVVRDVADGVKRALSARTARATVAPAPTISAGGAR